jgi:hypothetical protein
MEAQEDRLDWHAAFQDALKLEFEAYQDVLEFVVELQLTTQPLQIDAVIIKKKPDVHIELAAGKIFKNVNILEYKSPDDYFSVKDYFKIFSYAYLYLTLHKEANFDDITLSVVEFRHSRELFKFFEGRGLRVIEKAAGIYYIEGEVFPVQIIETRKLETKSSVWLSELRNDLDEQRVEFINEQFTDKDKLTYAAALFSVLVRANDNSFAEAMMKKYPTLDEVFEKAGLTRIWEARGEARANQKLLNLLKQGYSVDQIEKMLEGKTVSNPAALADKD